MSQENSSACISIDSENIKISERDMKGYTFELETNNVLHSLKIEYLSNPLQSIEVWKSRQGKGSDFKIPLWNWEIESKYSDGKVFPSWIDRDWIPRFKNGTFRVTVHNKGMKLSTNSLERCFIHDIYLIEIGYLRYVLKAEMKYRSRANKLLEAKNIKNQSTKNQNIEKQKQRSEIEGLELISSKSSATFKDKFRPKLGKISRLLGEGMNLLKSLWYDKCGSITLTHWIPVKLKTKNKTNRTGSQKMFSCPFRVVVVCSHYPQFYLCSLLIVYDCIQKLLRLGYNEDKIYRYLKNCLFKGMWQYKNIHLIKCRCKPISFIDNEIVDRRFRTTLSIFEPCKKYKCSTMIGRRICPYLLAIKKIRVKAKQLNLSTFMEGMMDGQEKRSSL
jgi:hypothetical protein